MTNPAPFQVIRQAGDVFVVSCTNGRTSALVTMSERRARATASRLNRAGA